MGFRQGAYAKVWKIEDKGNYSVAQVSVSRKDKESGRYNVEFQDGYVRMVGKAHEAAKSLTVADNGATIRITSCDVTNKYDKEKEKTYVNFVIFGFEAPDNTTSAPAQNSAKSNGSDSSIDEDELPF